MVGRTQALDFWAHLIYTTSLLICRLSGLAFFSRIADRQRKLTWAIRVTAALMTALWLPQMALIIFHCIPVTSYWPYAFEESINNYECLQWGVVYVTNSAISLVCDLALFTIPAIIIKELKISRKDKLKLGCIMMPGLLVIAISCARMYLVIVGQWDVRIYCERENFLHKTDLELFRKQADQSWSYNGLLTVEVAEISSTLVALSVPALKPFFGKLFAFLDNTYFTSPSSRTASEGTARRSSGFRLRGLHKKSTQSHSEPSEIRVRHSLAIENEMLGDSKWHGSSQTAVISGAREHSIASDRSEEPIIHTGKRDVHGYHSN